MDRKPFVITTCFSHDRRFFTHCFKTEIVFNVLTNRMNRRKRYDKQLTLFLPDVSLKKKNSCRLSKTNKVSCNYCQHARARVRHYWCTFTFPVLNKNTFFFLEDVGGGLCEAAPPFPPCLLQTYSHTRASTHNFIVYFFNWIFFGLFLLNQTT